MKRFQRACLPRLWAGTRVRGPGPGLSSEDAGLSGGLFLLLGSSLLGLPWVLPVALSAVLAAGLVRDEGEPRILHRCPEAWPCPFFPGYCGVLVPCALESGPSGVRTRVVFPAWLPPLLVSARPSPSASWVGPRVEAWPSSGWPWVSWWLPCGGVVDFLWVPRRLGSSK